MLEVLTHLLSKRRVFCSFDRDIGSFTFFRPFACNMCNYRSTNSSALVKHKRRHTGGKNNVDYLAIRSYSILMFSEKPYSCDQCDDCFSEKRDLTVHKTKDHDKVRPFECNQCDMKFYRKDFLLVHIRTLHGTSVNQQTA